jgi:hypothetical protein
MNNQIVNGTITIDGVLYKAFENSFSKTWYIVKGDNCMGECVARSIKAKSAREALAIWYVKMNPI